MGLLDGQWVDRPSFIGKVTGCIPADSRCVSIKSCLSSPHGLQRDTEPHCHRDSATYLQGKNQISNISEQETYRDFIWTKMLISMADIMNYSLIRL